MQGVGCAVAAYKVVTQRVCLPCCLQPKYYFWLLIIIARKFGIAFTSLMFRRNPGFQLAMALLVMFFAYAAQVKYAPFMSVSDREGVLEYNDRMAAEGSRLHSKIASTLRGVKRQQMRKRMRKWNDPRDDEKPTTKKKEVGDVRIPRRFGCCAWLLVCGVTRSANVFDCVPPPWFRSCST